jgi:glycosyltransferase involved in cell wall biosynthesis
MAAGKHKVKIAFAVTNCICHDQRVLKIAETAGNMNCEVTIIGRYSGDCCKSDSVPFSTKRFRMLFRKGFLFYKFYNIRLFFFLLFHRFGIIVSNDLDTLPASFLVSKLKRLPLVYDSHEYFTGVPELQNRRFVRWIWKSFERYIFPRLKFVMTVSDSIAHQYESEYKIRPLTVRNCSRRSDSIIPYSREELGFSNNDLLLILQGTGLNIDRGGKELIEALSITDNVSLMVVGSGDTIEELKAMTNSFGLAGRVRFFPKVPWNTLMRYTKSADAGVSFDKDTNINYRYSLPNKLFDYISAGIPVIAGYLPEVGKIISEHNCGILIPSVTAEEIKLSLEMLKGNRDMLAELKQNADKAALSINWEKESLIVNDFYKRVLLDIAE